MVAKSIFVSNLGRLIRTNKVLRSLSTVLNKVNSSRLTIELSASLVVFDYPHIVSSP